MKLVLTLRQAVVLARCAREGAMDLFAREDPEEDKDLECVNRIIDKLNLLIDEAKQRAATRRGGGKAL